MSESIKRHQDLLAWQRGIDLVEIVYRTTLDWPSDEKFGLTSQVRRAAVSIPANIAEGYGRRGDREFAHFLSIARGSLREVETYLVIAQRLTMLNDNDFNLLCQKIDEVGRLLHGLSRRLMER